MDIVSHGLWGSIAFGRKNKKSFWLAFLLGIAPDFFSFGIYTGSRLIQTIFDPESVHWSMRPPGMIEIDSYVHTLYNITHSFVVFALVFGIVWFIMKRPVWEMFAWAFHIFLDLFTHSTSFFPTPYLWPFSFTPIDGIPWSTPIIFFTNIISLAIIYIVYWYRKKRGMKV